MHTATCQDKPAGSANQADIPAAARCLEPEPSNPQPLRIQLDALQHREQIRYNQPLTRAMRTAQAAALPPARALGPTTVAVICNTQQHVRQASYPDLQIGLTYLQQQCPNDV